MIIMNLTIKYFVPLMQGIVFWLLRVYIRCLTFRKCYLINPLFWNLNYKMILCKKCKLYRKPSTSSDRLNNVCFCFMHMFYLICSFF